MYERPAEATSSGQDAPEPATWKARWADSLIAGVTLAAVVGMLVWAALGTGATSWRVYGDPLRLFHVRIPPQWTAVVNTSGYGEGNPAGSTSGAVEDIFFSDPAQGGGSAQLWVHVDQITSVIGQSLFCSDFRAAETTTFNGYPAADAGPGWLFESQTAHFQVAGTIPGVTESEFMEHYDPNAARPTPIPSDWARADQSLLASMLASLAPTAGPLACP